MGRPIWDFDREHDPDAVEEMSEGEFDKLQEEYNNQFNKYEEQDPNKHPDYLWMISKTASQMYHEMDAAFEKRDFDMMHMHIYNDTHGYAIDEVIKTHFLSFAKEYRKSKPNIGKLWAHLESFAWLAAESERQIGAWHCA